eukprot:TRINITY_DN9601_c0_g1_i1.p1 TRINITY_DN9601_c0_g1~~TRINITY_DN9601_c0_g1_i1.p1  ORF type:complete len:218 (-),score=51.83 TRINITY_DN9601_c0_g1_i1:141-794(-)
MPIIYGVVAQQSTIIAEYSATTGNFPMIARRILEKIGNESTRMSYVYDRYLFHYIMQSDFVFMCLADEEFGRRVPFAFLETIQKRFFDALQAGSMSTSPIFRKEFEKIIQEQMHYYSYDPNADAINQVRTEVATVRNVMVQNIEKIIERGEKLDLLVEKTDNLNQQSVIFKKQSGKLKAAMWWKNVKLQFILAFVILLILYFIIAGACGGMDLPKCT